MSSNIRERESERESDHENVKQTKWRMAKLVYERHERDACARHNNTYTHTYTTFTIRSNEIIKKTKIKKKKTIKTIKTIEYLRLSPSRILGILEFADRRIILYLIMPSIK